MIPFISIKLIIGVGTFSLALAFAGNDLVNFIGVPIAALESFQSWSSSSMSASEFSMVSLSEKVSTKPLYLFFIRYNYGVNSMVFIKS